MAKNVYGVKAKNIRVVSPSTGRKKGAQRAGKSVKRPKKRNIR